MNWRLVLFPLLSLSLGLFVLRWLWPRSDINRASLLLRSSFAVGIGMGVLSLLMFFSLLIQGSLTRGFTLALWGSLPLLLFCFPRNPKTSAPRSSDAVHGFIRLYFGFGLVLAITVFVFYFLKTPHGNWDAWSHWNLRARFIYWGGENWANAMSPDYWNPLNYPLLIPMVVAAGWGFVGAESHWVPGLTAMLFALGTILILSSSLGRIRGKTQGWLAGILLIGTPYFLTHGISQYSDIPVAFFFLATFAAAALYDSDPDKSPRFLILAGITAGLAGWTKNEGLLFVGCFCAARFLGKFLIGERRAAIRELFYFGAGLAPLAMVIVYLKTQFYAPETIFETRGIPYQAGNLTNLDRYATILSAYWENLFAFGRWKFSLTPLLAIYLLWMGIQGSRSGRTTAGITLITLFLMSCGYFGVYLMTPHNLHWHIATSIDRLFLCMWPSFLFGFFILVRTPAEALQSARQTAPASNGSEACI